MFVSTLQQTRKLVKLRLNDHSATKPSAPQRCLFTHCAAITSTAYSIVTMATAASKKGTGTFVFADGGRYGTKATSRRDMSIASTKH